MAAFCGCCGAEITLKAEACPVCGTPRHGMVSSNSHIDLASEFPNESAQAPQSPFTFESRRETRSSKSIPG